MPETFKLRGDNGRQLVRSQLFNIDNGAAATIDEALLCHSRRVTLLSAYVLYSGATTGTVAAATVGLGVAVGGVTVAAATALENAKAIGSKTALTLLITQLPANTPLIVRHTGIAATAAGEYRLVVEYEVNND